MTAGRYRALTAAAVLLVAAIAVAVSYLHVAALALAYGQPPLAAYLLPVSIDGLVATSSLVMLRSARAGASSPWLARTGLVLAVAATLAANVASGLAHGWPGAVLAGWPAVSFVVSAETAISMSRRSAGREPASGQPPATVAADAESAAKVALAASVAVGNGLSQRQLADRFGISRARAAVLAREVAAGSNGRGSV